MSDKLQKIFDEWPEEEPLLPVDNFFVGGVSDSRNRYSTESFNVNQLTGIHTVKDLKDSSRKKTSIQIKEDRDLFAGKRADLTEIQQYRDLFFTVKKKLFDLFDFIKIKSTFFKGVPFKEKDLVITKEDDYLIEYLEKHITDYFTVMQIATLQACVDMGIQSVRFLQYDDCPLCKAHDGLVYDVTYLMELLSSSGFAIHPYCACTWFPVIHRENYEGPLENYLNVESVIVEEVEFKNTPREFLSDLPAIASQISQKTVNFVNMPNHLLNEIEGLEDSEGVVVLENGAELLVHNSYVGPSGPIQFLNEFISIDTISDKMVNIGVEDVDIYIIDGREAMKKDGKYWDLETGKCLSS